MTDPVASHQTRAQHPSGHYTVANLAKPMQYLIADPVASNQTGAQRPNEQPKTKAL